MIIEIRNRKFEVVKETKYNHNGNERTQFTIKKLKGKKTFLVVKYENGLYSSIV